MLISRQGVGGDRAHTLNLGERQRTGPCVVISGHLSEGAFAIPKIRCETTFDHPDKVAEIDKEVAS